MRRKILPKHIKIAAGLAHVNYGNIAATVKTAMDAGADYVHSDAADMHDLKNMQLMGGHQIIEAIRPVTDKPIECHFSPTTATASSLRRSPPPGVICLSCPPRSSSRASGVHHELLPRVRHEDWPDPGLLHALCFVDESIYDIDRLQIVIHGVSKTDGKGQLGLRRTPIDLIRRGPQGRSTTRTPECELAVDGGRAGTTWSRWWSATPRGDPLLRHL